MGNDLKKGKFAFLRPLHLDTPDQQTCSHACIHLIKLPSSAMEAVMVCLVFHTLILHLA